ncbi:putative choice-of-anchor B domain-containing protein [Septoria linicola]|nr:putative choice-of-anchor B domain-containing protein [Septoria linicola]
MVRGNLYAASLCSALIGVSNALKYSSEQYASGEVHAHIMGIKMAQWEAEMQAGQMNSTQWPELGYTKCENGFAAAIPGDVNNTFSCNNIDLYHFLPHSALGSVGRGSSMWGWTSQDGREIVAIGQYDGTAFAEISSEGKIIYLGRLPQYDAIGSNWREIRIVGDYAIIGSEAIKHGVQIFDMKKTLELDPANPRNFTQDDLSSHWDELPVGRTHNIVVNEELNYAIACGSVGGNETIRVRGNDLPCRGGLIFLDLSDPNNVTSPGCAAGDGYVHDAECVVYRGPDERYYERDICYGYNEDTLTIYDVTNKTGNVTNIISRTTFPGAEYVHQGIVNNHTWQEYIFLDDEFDERDADVGPMTRGLPTTHIFDIRDLENPFYTGNFAGRKRSIDHNQYIVGDYLYQSNYGNGLNVWDISSVTEDPSGDSICEAGWFDIYPEDDEFEGGGSVAFLGSWHSYAKFKSGFIFVHTIERGSFVVKMTSKECQKPKVCESNACLSSLRASSIAGRLEQSQAFCHTWLQRLRDEESLIPDYARTGCAGEDVVAQVSSACSCGPTSAVPELPRTTSRPPVPTVLPAKRSPMTAA